MFVCCLSQQYGLQIIWQFWHVNNRQILGAGVWWPRGAIVKFKNRN